MLKCNIFIKLSHVWLLAAFAAISIASNSFCCPEALPGCWCCNLHTGRSPVQYQGTRGLSCAHLPPSLPIFTTRQKSSNMGRLDDKNSPQHVRLHVRHHQIMTGLVRRSRRRCDQACQAPEAQQAARAPSDVTGRILAMQPGEDHR